jgi:Uri superfamily endonuclease
MIGSYIFVIKLEKNANIIVGSLGKLFFFKGYYCYVGSALGKAVSLENRLGRYSKLSKEKKGNLYWHIDYLLVNSSTTIVGVKKFPNKDIECELACMLSKTAKHIVKFGSSDCNCKGHLFYFKNFAKIKKLLDVR